MNNVNGMRSIEIQLGTQSTNQRELSPNKNEKWKGFGETSNLWKRWHPSRAWNVYCLIQPLVSFYRIFTSLTCCKFMPLISILGSTWYLRQSLSSDPGPF